MEEKDKKQSNVVPLRQRRTKKLIDTLTPAEREEVEDILRLAKQRAAIQKIGQKPRSGLQISEEVADVMRESEGRDAAIRAVLSKRKKKGPE
jgi:hypothetical protein